MLLLLLLRGIIQASTRLRDWVTWLWWRWGKAHLLSENRVWENMTLVLSQWGRYVLARSVYEHVLVVVHLLDILHLEILVVVEADHREFTRIELEALTGLLNKLIPPETEPSVT